MPVRFVVESAERRRELSAIRSAQFKLQNENQKRERRGDGGAEMKEIEKEMKII